MKQPKAQTTNAADLLVEAGRALYGEEWIGPLARDLGVARNTVWQFNSGKRPLSADHPILKKIVALLERRRDQAARAVRTFNARGIRST